FGSLSCSILNYFTSLMFFFIHIFYSFISLFYIFKYGYQLHLHSFPTRRSSDLENCFSYVRIFSSNWANSSASSLFLSCFSIKSRSEEHTSELQSRENLVCRLLLVKKKKN